MQQVEVRPTTRRLRMSVIDIVAALAEHRRLIGLITFAGVVLAALFVIYSDLVPAGSPFNPLPDRYTSEAEIVLVTSGSQSSPGAFQQRLIERFTGLTGRSSQSDTNLARALLETGALADIVAAKFDFAKRYHLRRNARTRSRRIFARGLEASYAPGTGALKISYTDSDPVLATRILSFAIDVLLERFTRLEVDRVENQTRTTNQELGWARQDYTASQAKLVGFQSEHGVVDPAAQLGAAVQQFESLGARLVKQEIILHALEQRGLADTNQMVTRSKVRISVLKDAIAGMTYGVAPYAVSEVPADQMPRHEIEYADLKLQVSLERNIVSTLRRQYELQRLQAIGQLATFQVIEAPEIPEVPSGPDHVKIAVALVVIAFVLSCLIAVMMHVSMIRKRYRAEIRGTGPSTRER